MTSLYFKSLDGYRIREDYAQTIEEIGRFIIPKLADIINYPSYVLDELWEEFLSDAKEENEYPEIDRFILTALEHEF